MICVDILKINFESLGIPLKVIFILSNVSVSFCIEKATCWEFNLVPYKIDPEFSLYQKNYIKREINHILNKTCLYWIDMDESTSLQNLTKFVRFQKTEENDTFCMTRTLLPNETQPLRVKIFLSDTCFYGRTVLHEIVHALGFKHEHQRLDRDCYVWISERAKNSKYFRIRQYIPKLDQFPYDKQSIMHYARSSDLRALSERNYEMEPLGNLDERLTDLDVWKIQYRFCGRAHYCEVYHQTCRDIEQKESEKNCAKNYWQYYNKD